MRHTKLSGHPLMTSIWRGQLHVDVHTEN